MVPAGPGDASARPACRGPRGRPRAAGLDPTEEWSHRLASVALVNLGRTLEAVDEAREAVRLAPHLPIVRVQLAQAMGTLPELRRSAYDEALAAVTLDPTEPECHLVVADTARKLGWTRQAEAAYRQVLTMDPANAAAMNNLAVLRLQQGRTVRCAVRVHGGCRP